MIEGNVVLDLGQIIAPAPVKEAKDARNDMSKDRDSFATVLDAGRKEPAEEKVAPVEHSEVAEPKTSVKSDKDTESEVVSTADESKQDDTEAEGFVVAVQTGPVKIEAPVELKVQPQLQTNAKNVAPTEFLKEVEDRLNTVKVEFVAADNQEVQQKETIQIKNAEIVHAQTEKSDGAVDQEAMSEIVVTPQGRKPVEHQQTKSTKHNISSADLIMMNAKSEQQIIVQAQQSETHMQGRQESSQTVKAEVLEFGEGDRPIFLPNGGEAETAPVKSSVNQPVVMAAAQQRMPISMPSPATLAQQLTIDMQKAVTHQRDEIRIQLKPAELGSVHARLSIDGDGRVTAVFNVEDPNTRDYMRQHQDELARAMKENDVNLNMGDMEFNLSSEGSDEDSFGSDAGQVAFTDASMEEAVRKMPIHVPDPTKEVDTYA
ncbi:MAG: flagellar hook-length control protein FliK [Alphaproteobacteria bacterium]